MKQVYVVTEYGGEWEDRWTRVIGVCATKERAEQLQEESRKKNSLNNPIPEFEELYDKYCNWWEQKRCKEDSNYFDTNYIDGIAKMFPQYSKEELEQADKAYFSLDYIDTTIETINFYE